MRPASEGISQLIRACFSGRCEVLLEKGEFFASFPGLTMASFLGESFARTIASLNRDPVLGC